MISLLNRIFSAGSKNQKKNRARFKAVISDERFNYLDSVFNDLEKGVFVSDEDVLNAYSQFSAKMASNVVSLGELHFVLTATIASYKPNLAEELLDRPLEMLVVLYGDDLTVEVVNNFITSQILRKDTDAYAGLPNKKAITWLETFFINNQELVERKIKESIAEHYEDD